MRNILLILACVATVATSASAYSSKEKDCDCDDSRKRWIASEIIQQKETDLYKYFHRKNPSKSISVSGLLDILLKTLHILHKPYDSERILKSLGLETVEQAKEITRFIVDQIAQCRNVYQKYEVITDISEKFTNTFENNLAYLCHGETKYIDSKNNREADSYMKKWNPSPDNQDVGRRDRCFKRNGVVASAQLILTARLDNNIGNTRNTITNFHSKNGIVKPMPVVKGIFVVFYVEDKKLNAQFIKISINNGDGHMIYGLPQNSKDLPFVVEKLCNNTQRNILVNSMKRIQVEITLVRGAAFMKNSLQQYFIEEDVNLNGYTNVLKEVEANVNDIFQYINITLQIQSQGNVDSSAYRGNNKCSTKFVVDRPVAYKIELTKYNIPYGFGVYN